MKFETGKKGPADSAGAEEDLGGYRRWGHPAGMPLGEVFRTAREVVAEGRGRYVLASLLLALGWVAGMNARGYCQRNGEEWMLVLPAAVLVQLALLFQTRETLRLGASPPMGAVGAATLGAVPRVLGTGLLLACGWASLELLLSRLPHGPPVVALRFLGLAALLRGGVFAVQEAALGARDPLGAVVGSVRASRRWVRIGLLLAAMVATVVVLNLAGAAAFLLPLDRASSTLRSLGVSHATLRYLEPPLWVLAGGVLCLVQLTAQTAWTLIYLREKGALFR